SARRLAWQLMTIVIGSGLAWVGVMAQAPQELIIRNGLGVNVEGRRQADVRIRNGAIAEMGPNLAATAGAREIDARGRLLVPGGIDPNSPPWADRPAQPDRRVIEDYTTVSGAALAGGVTTVTNFI